MTLYIEELREWFELNKGDVQSALAILSAEYEPEEDNQAFRILSTAQQLADQGQGLGFTLKPSMQSIYKIDDREWFYWHSKGGRCFGAYSPGNFGVLNVAFDDVAEWRLIIEKTPAANHDHH